MIETKITKNAERLARALCVAESHMPNWNMRFDRAHIYWPEMLNKAKDIIEAQNLLMFCEDIRPLHGSVEAANQDKKLYERFYESPENHDHAFNVVLGLSND